MNQPLVMLVGTVLLIIGLAYYARAKGRHPAWCLMGFLSVIGLIVLACLKDYGKGATESGLEEDGNSQPMA